MISDTGISIDSLIAVTQEQVSSDLSGGVVILNMKDSAYYGLDEVGALVWNLIQQPHPVAAIRNAIMEQYEVEAGQCEQDLLALLRELRSVGLVEVCDATHANVPAPARA